MCENIWNPHIYFVYLYLIKNTSNMKECSKCKCNKDLIEFHKLKQSKDGLSSQCKSCKKKYDEKYRQSDKIQSLYKSDDYKLSKINAFNNNFLERKLLGIKSRLKHKGTKTEFSIKSTDLEKPTYCPLLGIKLDYEIGKGRKNWNAVSIDRIDNNKGYIPGNVWVISKLANTMKNCASISELITFSENTLRLFKK